MNGRVRRWPSAGFWFVLASWSLLVGFLGWGFSQPELDRVWEINQRMQRADFVALAPDEVLTLKRSLERHADLANAYLGKDPAGFVEPTDDGWSTRPAAHLIIRRTTDAGTRVLLSCRAEASAYPVQLKLEGAAVSQELVFPGAETQAIEVPAARLPAPQFVRVQVTAASQQPVAVQVMGEELP